MMPRRWAQSVQTSKAWSQQLHKGHRMGRSSRTEALSRLSEHSSSVLATKPNAKHPPVVAQRCSVVRTLSQHGAAYIPTLILGHTKTPGETVNWEGAEHHQIHNRASYILAQGVQAAATKSQVQCTAREPTHPRLRRLRLLVPSGPPACRALPTMKTATGLRKP